MLGKIKKYTIVEMAQIFQVIMLCKGDHEFNGLICDSRTVS